MSPPAEWWSPVPDVFRKLAVLVVLAFWSNRSLFLFMLAEILWTPNVAVSTSELTLISICIEQRERAVAELSCHIDLLRWVPKASLLSFLHDPGAY